MLTKYWVMFQTIVNCHSIVVVVIFKSFSAKFHRSKNGSKVSPDMKFCLQLMFIGMLVNKCNIQEKQGRNCSVKAVIITCLCDVRKNRIIVLVQLKL